MVCVVGFCDMKEDCVAVFGKSERGDVWSGLRY